jgi:DNA-binding response OmpR family regulator
MSETGLGKILVVDDDTDILTSIKLGIEADERFKGYEVELSTDGEDAIKKCEGERYSAIVLDLMLPKRGGFMVLQKIKQRDKQTPVIIITGNEGMRHRDYAFSCGADEYLFKPFALKTLYDWLAEHLRR